MLNRVAVLGRLTKDPELRKTNSDVSFATFSLAVDNPVKEADGTRGTLFIDCRIFGSQAESLVKYTRKGSKVAADGSINQRNFIRQDGTKGKAIEIIVDSVTFLDPKPEDAEEAKEPNVEDIPDDALPFDIPDDALPFDIPDDALPFDKPNTTPMTGKPLTPKGKK